MELISKLFYHEKFKERDDFCTFLFAIKLTGIKAFYHFIMSDSLSIPIP